LVIAVSLYQLSPPFLRLDPIGPGRPTVGTILMADLTGIPALAEAVTRLRQAPWCPLVTCLNDQRIPAASLSAFEPVPGAFAPLYAGDFSWLTPAARVRIAVARRPPPLPTTIAQWVERRLGRPGTSSTLAACFGEGGDALRPPRTLTRRVRALGPLEVRDWRGLARLAQILTSTRHPDRASLESAAFAAEVDPRTLRRWLRLATDLSWAHIEAWPGWEWVVEMTLRRYGYVDRTPAVRVSGE
jgi:hypothetical protein